MTLFILHMHNHAGWHTQHINAETLEAAIVKGLDRTADFLSQEYAGRYRVEHDDPASEFPCYRVIWDSDEPNWFGLGRSRLRKGEEWWSNRFQVGEPDDCEDCGGTGVNHYNPFLQCWACGDQNLRGKGSGKKNAKPSVAVSHASSTLAPEAA